jgi:type III restriction enzyme
MKIRFDANQEYQLDAIRAVTDIFDGQEFRAGEFEMGAGAKRKDFGFSETGVRNELSVTEEAIAENVSKIQKENGIVQDDSKEKWGQLKWGEDAWNSKATNLHFSVEMETGTGKTYVYLRTIFELHKRFGFSKFVIVVPSVAIREGVLKTIDMTREHLASLYDNVPADHFIYDSKKIGKLRGFASSDTLQIMIINIDAFNKKDISVIHRDNDRLSGRRPIEFIQETNPIVIMDEPQNMESEKAKEAIAELSPLCTLRYSATHKNYYNLLYKLDPVMAYDLGLVKRIEVDSVLADDDFNSAFAELVAVKAAKTNIAAQVNISVNGTNGVSKKSVSVKAGDDLYRLSKEREAYRDGFTVESIDAESEQVTFSNGRVLSKSEKVGGMDDEVMKMQIRETVREHLEKEKRVAGRGIKILSLFFVDKVKNYREYVDATVKQGKLAMWFEEVYTEFSRDAKYQSLDFPDVKQVHNGYFSQDKKGVLKDTTGSTQADDDTYALIMREKERLLSLDEPLKFIFSHSALREGWDNPNVFQICTLNETRSEIKKRQEIGRGLRLPVDQNGMRIFDTSINRLTVIANESYEDFAKMLQQEIREDCGVDFGERLKNKKRRKKAKLRKGFELDENFKSLWEKIRHKTQYHVMYESKDLIERASKAIGDMPSVIAPKVRASKAGVMLTASGVKTEVRSVRESGAVYGASLPYMPDVLGHLQGKTRLTKSVLGEMLQRSRRIGDVLKNPQQFLDLCVENIDREMKKLMVDGIKYEKIAGESYSMMRFKSDEIEGYVNDLFFKVEKQDKTLYDHLVLDSKIETEFAKELEAREEVKFYIKLPGWFKIETPIGTYNPDWAIVFHDDRRRVYFVAETKGDSDIGALREEERQKIRCGAKHFEELDGVEFHGPVKSLREIAFFRGRD